MDEQLTQAELWRVYRAAVTNGVQSTIIAKLQRIIEAGFQYDVDEDYSEVRDLAGLMASHGERLKVTDENVTLVATCIDEVSADLEETEDNVDALFEVIKHQQGILEVQQEALRRLQEVCTVQQASIKRIDAQASKFEETIALLLLDVGCSFPGRKHLQQRVSDLEATAGVSGDVEERLGNLESLVVNGQTKRITEISDRLGECEQKDRDYVAIQQRLHTVELAEKRTAKRVVAISENIREAGK